MPCAEATPHPTGFVLSTRLELWLAFSPAPICLAGLALSHLMVAVNIMQLLCTMNVQTSQTPYKTIPSPCCRSSWKLVIPLESVARIDLQTLPGYQTMLIGLCSVYDLSKAPQIGQRSHHWRCADVASLAISSWRGTANSAAASTAFSASKTWKKRLNNWKKLIERYWKNNFILYSTMSWRGG